MRMSLMASSMGRSYIMERGCSIGRRYFMARRFSVVGSYFMAGRCSMVRRYFMAGGRCSRVRRYFMAGRCSVVGEVMGRFFPGVFSYVMRELVSIFLNCVDRRRMTLLRDCIFSCVWGVGVCRVN